MARSFCPVCGRPTDVLYSGLCKGCYIKSNPLISVPSRKVEVVICPSCLSYKLKGKWVPSNSSTTPKEIVLRRVLHALKRKGEIVSIKIPDINPPDFLSGGAASVILKVKGRVLGEVDYYEEEYVVPLRIVHRICPKCRDLKSKREMARIQVRAKNRPLSQEEIRLVEKTLMDFLSKEYERDKSAVPIKVERKKGGLDYVFSSKRVARAAVARIQKTITAKLLETHKDIGLSPGGRKITRTTYRLLLPPFKPGDIVEYRGEIYYVKGYSGGRVSLASLATYSERVASLSERAYESFRVISDAKSLPRGLIVSVVPPYVYLMDLRTYRTEEIRMEKIPLYISEGREVGILEWRGRRYILPLP